MDCLEKVVRRMDKGAQLDACLDTRNLPPSTSSLPKTSDHAPLSPLRPEAPVPPSTTSHTRVAEGTNELKPIRMYHWTREVPSLSPRSPSLPFLALETATLTARRDPTMRVASELVSSTHLNTTEGEDDIYPTLVPIQFVRSLRDGW